jgi:hypothetical protein
MSAPVVLRPTEITGRYMSSRYWEPADRMWLTEIEDAAALLALEDKLSLVEIEARVA